MFTQIRLIYVPDAQLNPEIKIMPPLAMEYERLFGHEGMYVKIILPSIGTAYGEMLYSVSDAKYRKLPFNRTLTFPGNGLGYDENIYGPFLIVGMGIEEVSLRDARIKHWLTALQTNLN